MKKILSTCIALILMFGVSINLFACAQHAEIECEYIPDEFYVVWEDNFDHEYKVDVEREKDQNSQIVSLNLEYLACYEELGFKMQGIYSKDGVKLDDRFMEEYIITIAPIDLSILGTKTLKRFFSVKCEHNGQWLKDFELTFDFIVTVTPDKSFHQYVTIFDVEIPFDYFACEMQEVAADAYNLYDYQNMLGVYSNKDDYEYGCWIGELSPDGKALHSSSDIKKRQTKDGNVYQTEMYHHVNPAAKESWETYQYTQINSGKGYLLNETDGVFNAGRYSVSGNSGWSDYMPIYLEVLKKGTDIVYKAAEKDGYLYLSISGILPNNEYWDTNAVKATYKIQGNKIVAWLYEETHTSPYEDNYWKYTYYCIPLEGEIELVDEELLDSVCNK